MLRKISKENRPVTTSSQMKKQKNIPISESFSDLKYLSSLCFTNFNGVFHNTNINNFDSYRKLNDISQSNSINNLILKDQTDVDNKKLNQSASCKVYSTSNVTTKLNSKTLSKKNLNVSSSTKSSLDEYNTANKQRTISTKFSTLTPSSNQAIFKKINTYKKKKVPRCSSQPRIQKLTKINRTSNLSSIQDFETALNTLQTTYLTKLRTKMSSNQKESNALSSSIKTLSTHVRSISQELDRSKEINISMTNESVRMGYNLKRLIMQNKNIENEINAYRQECESVQKQINSLKEDTIHYENEIANFDDNIDEMKKQIKILPELIHRCEEDKKNLMTAILIVKKKSDELRAEIYKMDNNKDYLGQDLEAILDYYKDAEI